MPLEQLVSIFITLGAAFLIGLVTDLLGQFTRLPRVTLLLVFGFLVGPSGLALIPDLEAVWVEAASRIALVMVGFLLGEKLTLTFLREQGRLVLSVSLAVSLATIGLVFAGLLFIGVELPVALLLGAMATATAPAAVLDVVRESGAKGRFTNALLAIVAIDDIWGLLFFSLILTLLVSLAGGSGGVEALGHGLMDIGGALVVGLGLGLPMALLTGRLRAGEPTQAEALGFIFLCAGLALWLDVSFILAAMVLGLAVANLAKHHKYPFHEIEGIEWPFLILFFIIAGASLDLAAVRAGGAILIAYIVLRVLGRFAGGWLGAAMGAAPAAQRRWFGVALLPQAGVALGMALIGAQRFPQYADQLLSVAIAATVVFELTGPVFTRLALARQGESG